MIRHENQHLTPTQIANGIVEAHNNLWNYVDSLDANSYEFKKDGSKWNGGQQAHHILKSCQALLRLLWMPDFLMKRQFGRANRPSRTPAEVVKRYHEKLNQVDSSTTPFLADNQSFQDKDALLKVCRNKSAKIAKKFNRYSEERLDKVVLPHPLLGKVTLREMGYFFIHHAQHHHNGTVENLKSKP